MNGIIDHAGPRWKRLRYRTLWSFSLLAFLPWFQLLPSAQGAWLQTADAGASLKSYWPVQSPHVFHGALRQDMGFSLTYGDKTLGPEVPAGWQVSTRNGGEFVETVFRDRTGLAIVREVRSYPEAEAIEYTLRIRNESPSILPSLRGIKCLDVRFGEAVLPGISVLSSGGGLDQSVYPPDNFALRRQWIGSQTPVNGHLVLTTIGNRSSNYNLPFYFIENAGKQAGLLVGIGWTGPWTSRIGVDFATKLLRLTAEVPGIDLQLRPGEEISSPRILIGCYRGPLSSGSNRLRRLIRERYTPALDGRKPEALLTYDSFFGVGHKFDEQLLRKLADKAAEIGEENFLLDAGWYTGTNDTDGFTAGIGNWEEVDRAKFPSGLKAFADYVRSKGLKFGLWFDPESAVKGSLLAKQHPDWVIFLTEDQLRQWLGFAGDIQLQIPFGWAEPGSVFFERYLRNYGLVDFSRPDVQQWMESLLDRYIRELDIRYLRLDFTLIDALPYWALKDTPGRRGLSQIRHIEGFNRVLDWVRKRHPETVFEGCAGGGRRIDLETARRSHVYWTSDHTESPDLVRFHLQGLNHFLPGNYAYACYILPLAHQEQFAWPDLDFQSFFAGSFGISGRVDEWPQAMRDRARKHVEVYKKLRRFLTEDYYALTPQPRDFVSWQAWQFHSTREDAGFVQAFRLESPQSSMKFNLQGLNPATIYRFYDPYSGVTWQMRAAKALSEGVPVDIPPQSSKVLMYEPAVRPK